MAGGATGFVEFDAVTLAQQFGVAKHKHEKVIYYRKPETYPAARGNRPRKALEAGWITHGDSNQTARDTQLQKGHVPLPGYGYIRENDPHYQEYGNLGPLLFHPGDPRAGLPPGAHLFPVDQIVAYGWYDAAQFPELVGMFPQLKDAEVVEYPCPDCEHPVFHDVLDLGRHLRNAHNYDRTDLATLGQELGISFARLFEGKSGKRVVRFDDQGDATAPGGAGQAPPVMATVQRVKVPSRASRAAGAGAVAEESAE